MAFGDFLKELKSAQADRRTDRHTNRSHKHFSYFLELINKIIIQILFNLKLILGIAAKHQSVIKMY